MSQEEGHGLNTPYAGCGIPPEVYDIAFSWDPQPEVERLLFVCPEMGAAVHSALELGCGTGRLLTPLRAAVPDVVGLEISPGMAEYARGRSDAKVGGGDMSDFRLGGTFDLVFTSANTIRHVLDDAAIRRMWRCVADHLKPGGVFVADLELGVAAEAERAGVPVGWNCSRGAQVAHVTWAVARPPSPAVRRTGIEWTFELREGATMGRWRESFELRAYDAGEFVDLATADGRLDLAAIYELRDPYLIAVPADRAVGRMLVVLRRAVGE